MRSLSLAARRAVQASETSGAFPVLLEISHPSLPEPIRVVNNTVDLVYGGKTYTAFPFKFDPPDERDDQIVNARMTICNVDRSICATLRQLETAPTVRAVATFYDDVRPEIPDNPAGTVYRNDAAWTGWGVGQGAKSVLGGVLRADSTGDFWISRQIGGFVGKLLYFRIRASRTMQVSASYYDGTSWHWHSGQVQNVTTDWKVCRVQLDSTPCSDNWLNIDPVSAQAGDWVELSDLYIGDGSYLSPTSFEPIAAWDFLLRDVSYDSLTVSGSLIYEDRLDNCMPALEMTPYLFPGVVA